MDKTAWKEHIKGMTDGVGTYRKEFDSIIDTLSDILEQRDRVYQDFIDSGAEVVITKVSDRGAENIAKNPRLALWSELNTQALAFWRDLGLTPAGLKRINELAIKAEVKESALELALRKIGEEESNEKLESGAGLRRKHSQRE